MKKLKLKKSVFMSLFTIIVFALFLTVANLSVRADGLVTYDGNLLDAFQNRTKEEIGEEYSKALAAGETYRNWDSSTYYESTPSLESPYSAGSLTNDTLEAMTAMANYYRWLVGVEPFSVVASSKEDLQAGALVRNYDFAHSVDDSKKPSDMSDDLWNMGADVSHNILARGYSPRGSITGWLNEGYNLRTGTFDTVGHRTTIISPTIGSIDFGYAGSVAIGDVTSSSDATEPYVVYPAPTYMPLNGISVNETAWSVQLNSDYLRVANGAMVVKVTNLNTNESYECSKANGLLTSEGDVSFYAQPSSTSNSYNDGDKFKIEITGLEDIGTGDSATIVYTTEFFDVSDYADTIATDVFVVDGYNNVIITDAYNNIESLEKIASILPTTLKIETETGREASVPVEGKWIVDTENKKFINSADTTKLPSYVTDPDGVLDNIEITYTVEDYTGSFSNSKSNPTEGDQGEFLMWRNMLGTNLYKLYQVKADTTGYTGIERLNQDSENVKINDNGYVSFTIDGYTLNDTGTYLAIYYSNNSSTAYLAGMKDITVKEKEIKSISVTSPSKNTYKVGEELDLTDGSVNITYVDDTNATINITSDMISNFSSSTKGLQEVTVTYKNKTTTFDILVVDNPSMVEGEYGDILSDITLPTNQYGKYEFVLDGTTSLGEIGTKTFEVIYIPNDDTFNRVTGLNVTVNVLKGTPTYSTTLNLTATYGDTLLDITLPDSDIGTYEFEQLITTSVGNAGRHEDEFTVKFVPNDTDNYKTVTNIPVVLEVEKAIPTYTIPTDIEAGYGDTLSDVILPEGFTWNNLEQLVGEVGEREHIATYTPEDTDNYKVVNDVKIMVTVGKTTPEYEVPRGLTATYGDTLRDITLIESENGTYSFVDDLTTSVGNAGTNTFKVKFTPNDTTNYREVIFDVEIVVSKANPEYDDIETLTATYKDRLNNVSLPTATNGKFVFMDELTKEVGNAGLNTFMVKFIPNDTDNYNIIENIEVTINVAKANPTYEIPTNLTVEYGKTLKDIILPEGWSFDNKDEEVGSVGTHKFMATYTPGDTTNYNTVSLELEVEVTKIIPNYEIPTGLTATYGDTLMDVILPTPNNGKFEFEDLLTTSVGNVGEHIFNVKFTPTDLDNYEVVEHIPVTITVNKKKADLVEIPKLDEITYNENITLNDISLPEGWSFDNKDIVPTVGNSGYKATYTPKDTVNYDYSDQDLNPTLELIVNKARPVFANPVVIAYNGDTLNDVELPTLTNGKFVWNADLSTSVGNVGTHEFMATFIPNDTNNYETITDVVVTVEVGKTLPEYEIPTGLTAVYGDTLSDIILPAGFTWNNKDESVGNVGNKTFLATFTPEDTDNYAIVTNIEIPVTVNKKKADLVEIPKLDEITYNENITLNDITLPEGWNWDNKNTVPTVGNSGYKATYTPRDTENYDYSDQNLNPTLELIVNKANPTYEVPTNITIPYGSSLESITLPVGFSFEETGLVGEIGKYTYKLTYTPTDTTNYNIIKDIEVTVEVVKANPDIEIPSSITIEESGLTLKDISLEEGWQWLNSDEIVNKSGMYKAVYIPEDEEHYNTITKDIYIEIKSEEETVIPTDEKENIVSPETSDNIVFYLTLLGISITSITGLGIYLKLKKD